jgi:hypothetical protein
MSNFFTDVIMPDPRFEQSQRVADIALLEPQTRAKVQAIIDDAQAHGVALMVWETFRSKARQMQLFAAGVTKLRQVGVHQYGLACDLVKSIDGEPSWKGDFSLLGSLAGVHGLIWGGDWGQPKKKHTFVDAVHVQRCSIGRQASLFRGTWYPDDAYDPYADLSP